VVTHYGPADLASRRAVVYPASAMSLRPAELAELATELNAQLRGAFLQKAWVPDRSTAYLELRQPGRSTRLCLCAAPGVGRISVADARTTSEQAAPLQRWVRAQLTGAQLQHASAAGSRLKLSFATRAGPRALGLDLFANALLLLADADRVLSASSEAAPAPRPGSQWTLDGEPTGSGEGEAPPSRLRPPDDAPLGLLRAAEQLLGQAQRAQRATELRRQLVRPLKQRRTQLLRTLEKVRAEAARGPDAERHRGYGELVAQNVHRLTRGARTVRLTAYTEEGVTELDVPLDPARPPREQAERHFHQYRRLTRGVEHAGRRLVQLEEELAALEAELLRVEALPEALLPRAAAEPATAFSPKRKAGPARHVAFREFRASDGGRILVGKGGADNDTLTFKVARPFDAWLHALGSPGAHVVVPLQRGEQVPEQCLIDAAHLALHFSPLKEEPRGEVAWTYARFVRKPRDAGPGAVLYTRERVLLIRVERGRLERLLSSNN